MVDAKGLDKTMVINTQEMHIYGPMSALGRENRDNLMDKALGVVKEPYDLAGTATMQWEYMDDKKAVVM